MSHGAHWRTGKVRRPSKALYDYTKELKLQMAEHKVAAVLGCSFVTVDKILDGYALIATKTLDALEARHGKR